MGVLTYKALRPNQKVNKIMNSVNNALYMMFLNHHENISSNNILLELVALNFETLDLENFGFCFGLK